MVAPVYSSVTLNFDLPYNFDFFREKSVVQSFLLRKFLSRIRNLLADRHSVLRRYGSILEKPRHI